MKLTKLKRRFAFAAAAVFIFSAVAAVLPAAAADTAKPVTLLNRVLEEDGFLYGINYTWLKEGRHLAPSQILDYTNDWFTDGQGEQDVYTDMINLKALGYNAVQIVAQGNYMDGVQYDATGHITGLSDTYKTNFRKYMEIMKATDTHVAVILQFHTTRIYEHLGKKTWDKYTRFYGDPTVRREYMELVMTPILDILADYQDTLLYVALGDELENEINDTAVDWNLSGNRAVYGVSYDQMHAFYSDLNDLCREKLPTIPRTIAANADFFSQYEDMGLTVMGHNHYTVGTEVPAIDRYLTSCPLILTEYGVASWDAADTYVGHQELYEDNTIQLINNAKDAGYIGAFWWSFCDDVKEEEFITLFNSNHTFRSDMNAMATKFYYDYLDDQYKHDRVSDAFDEPRMLAQTGDGHVAWLPSRQGKTMDLERSYDGGDTWEKLLTGAACADHVSPKNPQLGYYKDDTAEDGRDVCYRVTVYNGLGDCITGDASVTAKVGAGVDVSGFDTPANADTTNDEPAVTAGENLLTNGDFENNMAGWRKANGGVAAVKEEASAYGEPGHGVMITGPRWGRIEQTIPVLPGKLYRVTFNFKDVDHKGVSICSVRVPAESYQYRNDVYFRSNGIGWHTKELFFSSMNASNAKILFCPETENATKYIDNVHIELVGDDDIVRTVTSFKPQELTVADPTHNLIGDAGFETGEGPWNVSAFADGTLCRVEEQADRAHSGSRYLRFAGTGSAAFYMDVEPNTEYLFSAWVRGPHMTDENRGDVTFGVTAGTGDRFLTGEALSYLPGYLEDFSHTRQLVPTAYDDAWHLRGLTFNSGNMSRIGITITGTGSELNLDDLVLCKKENAVRYTDPRTNTNLTTHLFLGGKGCRPEDNLLQNFNIEDKDISPWTDVPGYGRFVHAVAAHRGYGNSLRYTASEKPLGQTYTKWVEVKPHTDYVFSCRFLVTEAGEGRIGLLDGRSTVPAMFAYEVFDADMYGDEWATVAFPFNSDIYTRIGIVICDKGGKGYIDNLRLFEEADAVEIDGDDGAVAGETVEGTGTEEILPDYVPEPENPEDDGDDPAPADPDTGHEPTPQAGESRRGLWLAVGALLLTGTVIGLCSRKGKNNRGEE